MSDDQQIDALRDDIEQTRGDMSQTIEQLQERLAPERLQRDTGEIVQEVADRIIAEIQGKTGDLTTGLSAQIQTAVHGAATAKTDELLTNAAAGARAAGASLWERVATNPAPLRSPRWPLGCSRQVGNHLWRREIARADPAGRLGQLTSCSHRRTRR